MRSREFDEKERLEKANEKLEKYKTAAGADAATADASGNFARGNTRFKGINRAPKKQFANDAKLSQLKEFAPSDDGNLRGVAEGVAETVSMDQAKKVLRHYGADHFKTTTNELHFYKNGRPMSVDLIFNDDATRSVNLSQLNSATRRLKGQGVTEMDKSEPSAGRDGGPRPGPDREAKPIAAKKATKDMRDMLNRAVKDAYKKKDVKEDQLDELSIDTLRNYMRAQPARIKGPAGLATTNPKKAARIVDPEKGDMRRALTKLKDPAYGQQGMAESNVFTDARMNAIKADQDTFVVHGKTYQVTGDTTDERQAGLAEDSISAMRRLAGIVTPTPAVASDGPRQYRHMPTAVQPR